jgi:hypothetical protein
MKNAFSFLAFLLVSNFAFGQIKWVGNHDFFDGTADILRTSQGQYVLLHSNGSGLTVFDDNGGIVFEDTIFQFTDAGISDIIELPDSSFMLVLGGIDCDILLNFYVKYDKNWNKLGADYTYGRGFLAKFSDNSIALADDFYGLVEKLDIDGNQVWYKDLYPNYFNDLVIKDDSLFVATTGGLIKITTDGIIAATIPSLVFDRLETMPNGNFIAQQNNGLSLYSPDFALLATFQSQGETIGDIAFGENQVAVLTSAPKVVRLDFDLNELDITLLSGHNQTFSAVSFSENGLMMGGSERYGNNGHENTAAFIKEYGLDGNTSNSNEDVALIDVAPNGIMEVDALWGSLFAATLSPISITIENNGTTAIEWLNLNLGFPDFNVWLWECKEVQVFSKSFENLNLQPGASVQLDWGSQLVYFGEDPSGMQLELCFWTSLPNHHLETNNDNDVSCTEVLVAAHEPLPISYHHAFNATADELYIDLPTELDYSAAKANIFNAAGQLVHAEGITEMRQTLLLHDLTDGVYFLQVLSGERVGWGKFAKY